MKKLILIVAAIWMVLPASIGAANQLTMSGCGLGYVIFGKDNPRSRGLQILALTTNGTVANQLFGITSGTSGCTEDGALASNKQIEIFADINFTNLSEEMAKGEGEYVTAFASLLGAGEASQPALLNFFQDNYEVLIPSAETTSDEMLTNLERELETHPGLLG